MRCFGIAILISVVVGFSPPVSAAPPARTEGFVTTVDGTKLYYIEKGSGPDVLIAPTALYLEPHLLEYLSTGRRVIFYDPRNRGRSDRADLSSISLDRQI